jgi:hypothetical protein
MVIYGFGVGNNSHNQDEEGTAKHDPDSGLFNRADTIVAPGIKDIRFDGVSQDQSPENKIPTFGPDTRNQEKSNSKYREKNEHVTRFAINLGFRKKSGKKFIEIRIPGPGKKTACNKAKSGDNTNNLRIFHPVI